MMPTMQPNNAINTDSQKRRSFVTPLLAADYGERYLNPTCKSIEENYMKDDYKKKFEEFISEVLKQDIREFGSPKKWKLSSEPLNGVDIGCDMPSKSSRALLHEIGQKHGLIPLCPGDLIDLELTDDFAPKCMVVISTYGRFMIKPNNSRDRKEFKLL